LTETTFGQSVREKRADAGWSLRDLAERITFHRGYVGKVEQGEKFPERQFAELADAALGACGDLVALWDAERDARKASESTARLLTASVSDSLRLIEAAQFLSDVDQVNGYAAQLAIDYLSTPAGPMLLDAVEMRGEVMRRLNSHDYRPRELPDLYMALARVQGVLAYAALDLGNPAAAMTHTEAGWACAERIDSNEMRAWVRGTQSLIARFEQRYDVAEKLVHDGLNYPVRGTGRLRLLAGLAQCRANQGDSAGANEALDIAAVEREELTTTDEVEGLFGFTRAKQHYYAGSSLMWLQQESDLQRAASEAATAVQIWESETPATRSLDDEALAHIYSATARARLGDISAAEMSIQPILDMPADRRISWIIKRLRDFADSIDRFAPASLEASALVDKVRRISG
jgi:transcriptional regulator with XRE-family HTH domain